jgi:bifunctional pyridoxal-dependent enzyme with beta-cystathionase and maltose regulon repressor activities
MWVAEMDSSLPAVVRARLDELLDMADLGYASATVLAQAWEAFAADRWGWQRLAAGTDASDELASINESALHGTSHLGELAHATALTEALLREAPHVRHRPGAATAFAWLDFRETGLGEDPAAILLERGRVALSPGPAFGTVGAGHARLNLATSKAVLREALDRILGVLDV